VLFHANAHADEPVHVHGKSDGRECRAEILLVNGAVTDIRYTAVARRAALTRREMQYFDGRVSAQAEDIARRWIGCSVPNSPARPERITRRLQ
jgi:hypothetical protein